MVLAVCIVAILTGCTQIETSPVLFQRHRFETVGYDDVFRAAERAVSERFRVELADTETGVIRAVPASIHLDPTGTRVLSKALGSSTEGRELVEVLVQRKGSSVEILCRVLRQELETERFRVMDRERGVDDQATDTPAARYAGTTPEQNAVWVTRSRDREMERSLLASIREIAEAP